LGRGEGGGGCVDMSVADQCSWMEKVNRPAKPVARARVAKILRDIVMVFSLISTEKSVWKVVKRLNVTDVCIIKIKERGVSRLSKSLKRRRKY
jgi:hypothetical protein